MNQALLPYVLWAAAALAILVIAEWKKSQTGIWIVKPVASTAFIAAGLASGALRSHYGIAILVGLCFSWWGDILLIPKSKKSFLLGLVSFLLGHVAYTVAFCARGLEVTWTLGALFGMGILGGVMGFLYLGRVEKKMQVPVFVYGLVITLMVGFAAGTVAAHGKTVILVGAAMFYISDLFVARQRFFVITPWNRALGLPLYYGSQLLIASSVAM